MDPSASAFFAFFAFWAVFAPTRPCAVHGQA
jgi:hypothetical protein